VTTTRARPPRIPAAAQRLRLPIWQRAQLRTRERYGFDLGQTDALEKARTLVAEQPGDADVVLLLAAVLALRGDSDLAEQQARRALDLAPDLARAHTTLATLLMHGDRAEEGLSHARRAARLDDADPSVLYNLGLAEWVAGDRHVAREALRRAEAALAGTVRAGEPTPRPRRWWRLGRRSEAPPDTTAAP